MNQLIKSELGYLVDLHCHTISSYDAYTSEEDLLQECINKKIAVIAITEHDKVSIIDRQKFADQGVLVIPSCEFTTDKGAHIIGFFVEAEIPFGSSRETIFEHIIDQGGISGIPHPYKPGTGYLGIYPEDDWLNKVALMEIHNGGWPSRGYRERIQRVADRYDIRTIVSSDSHRPNHVGYLVNAFADFDSTDPAGSLVTNEFKIYRNSNIANAPRQANFLQRNPYYQELVNSLPYRAKRSMKLAKYFRWRMTYRAEPAKYMEIER